MRIQLIMGGIMSTKEKKRTNLEANEAFLQYEEAIANHPAYAGMPDLRREDGSIQWETPSNRGAGIFQFSHDKRYQWWEKKPLKSESVQMKINGLAKWLKPFILQNCIHAKFVDE